MYLLGLGACLSFAACNERSPPTSTLPGNGDDGEAAAGPCPLALELANDAMAALAGSYTTRVRTGLQDTCSPATDTVLHVEITSILTEEELAEKPCGAAWLPVTLALRTEDGAVERTERGVIGTVDGQLWGRGQVLLGDARDASLRIEPDNRSVSVYDLPGVETPCCDALDSLDEDALAVLSTEDAVELSQVDDDARRVKLDFGVTSVDSRRTCDGPGLVGGGGESVVVAVRDPDGVLVGEARGLLEAIPLVNGCERLALQGELRMSAPRVAGLTTAGDTRGFLTACLERCAGRTTRAYALEVPVIVDGVLEERRFAVGGQSDGGEGRVGSCW
ncbi:MAG: hypothetical protein RL385_1155 [Pseudomonadota bacterium]